MSLSDTLAQHLSEAAAKNVTAWLSEPKYAEYRTELTALVEGGKWQELEDAFFKVIEFGTAGRRGATGVGANRINNVTIGESAQALCQYAASVDADSANKGVVIAYDTRISSPELSRYAAQVCAANGYKTYLFESFRSTPELSFAVRHLGAAVGIVISASHNPPADNGFKAYWSDGGQIASPHDTGILAVAERTTDIKVMDYNQAMSDGKISLIGAEVDEAYLAAVVAQAEGQERRVRIIYSPLHGAGQTSVLPALKKAGFSDISVVEEQMTPDGEFPTVKDNKPNPEEKAANDLAVAKMLRDGADIAITNDPDADRVGVMVNHDNTPVYLSGNQAAVLAADYILLKRSQKGILSPGSYIAKTIVTTDMLAALADHYGVSLHKNMLIGFKYIAQLIRQKEDAGTFIMAAEESFGLLKGDYARDKDGATGALPLAEYAAELKQAGKTLYDRLMELYVQHGLYVERLDNAYFPGADGFRKMQEVMEKLRHDPPANLGGHTVTAIQDYQTLRRQELKSGSISPIDCIKGNVVVLEFDGDERRRITVRPSGTEPKMKFYIQWFDAVKTPENVKAEYDDINTHLSSLSKELEGMLLN